MSDYTRIAAATAERLQALDIGEIVYFHCDHFEPWGGNRSIEESAEAIARFVDAVNQVDFARRLTLFYHNAWNIRFGDDRDLVRAAPHDRLGFARPSPAEHEIKGAPLRYLRQHSELEVQIHIHHENFTWVQGLKDAKRAAYMGSAESRALDGPRLECAIELWLQSARREFDYAPERWFFVHGLWSLNGSDPEGCNIHDEMARLVKHGCLGDFTFPAGRPHCDPRFEAPYFCLPATGPKAYDSEKAAAEFAWGNREAAAADKFFIWNAPIKAMAASLDWGDREIRKGFAEPEKLAQEIVERSFRWDGVLFIKTHAHSMHGMNIDDSGALVHPHCYGPIRDLYGAIFEGAARAGAAVTLATAAEVYDRFLAAPRPQTLPDMGDFRPRLAGKELRFVEPTGERVLAVAGAVDALATAAIRARIAELGVQVSGAEEHYALLAERGSVLLKHDVQAAHILLSHFGKRCAVHEIGAGIGVLPLLLAALGIPALGIEGGERRYEACIAVGAHVAAQWGKLGKEELAPHDYLFGSFPECLEGEDLSQTVAVMTDFTCGMTPQARRELILALHRYGAVLLDLDRFIRRITGSDARRELVEELRSLGFSAIHDADITSDYALVLIINNNALATDTGTGAAAGRAGVRALAARDRSEQVPRLRVVLPGPFVHEEEHCWVCRLGGLTEAPLLASLADTDALPRRSPLRLCEDGRPLGPPHSLHAVIRQTGGGAFSHWKDELYLSIPDDSDPNRNGRLYELRSAD
ncbi:MAG: hypothetical protein ACM3JG_03990 [Thiohalocapsa sp.]